jgi:hypothetical protein
MELENNKPLLIQFKVKKMDTAPLQKPCDPRFTTLFSDLAQHLLENYKAFLCYTQGTRIVLLFKPALGRKHQYTSPALLASYVTMMFQKLNTTIVLKDNKKWFVTFDVRVKYVGSLEAGIKELKNMKDCDIRKTIAIVWEKYYPVDQGKGVITEERKKMIELKGDKWENYDEAFRMGSVFVREKDPDTDKWIVHNKQNYL